MEKLTYNKINIYNRHYSNNRINPDRPKWFNYEKTFVNLLKTTNFNLCNLNIIFEKEEDYDSFFIKKYENQYPFKVRFIDTTREKWLGRTFEDANWSRGIAAATRIINDDKLPENELVYLLDDDYLHVPYWSEVTLDYVNNFLQTDNFWICLCDYGDKYYFIDEKETIDPWGTNLGMYKNLTSKIRLSNYCHWRSVPSVLGSSMMPVKIFNRDFESYWKMGYSDGALCGILNKQYGTEFWTPIKSLNCHVIHPFMAPFIDWERMTNL
jgi:hypothetical protein